MTDSPSWRRRFLVRGVFWRQFLRWAVLNVPIWLEPLVIATWSGFFLLWGPGRRGVMRNLSAILPGSSALTNFFRTYRVFWNYAWTITDTMRFRELRTLPDWTFDGYEHFDTMEKDPGGAILLTAHMGSYDLGAHLFTDSSRRSVVMVRAPESDPETQQFETDLRGRTVGDALRVGFNTSASDLAFDLLAAVRRGEIIAIQGDRVTPGIATIEGLLFGRPMAYPAGPFALAMAAEVPIYPTFVLREGRRSYRLLSRPRIVVRRTSRDRDADLRKAVEAWTHELEGVLLAWWPQWFTFEVYYEMGTKETRDSTQR